MERVWKLRKGRRGGAGSRERGEERDMKESKVRRRSDCGMKEKEE